MSDPNIGSRAHLGARCRELMKSEVFTEALGAVNTEYEQAILKSKPGEVEKRELLFAEYTALKRAVHRLRNWESDGAMAQLEMDAETPE